MKYQYIGVFVSQEGIYAKVVGIGKRLAKLIKYPHVTFKYRPDAVDESVFGEEVKIKIVGYGNDGENEGLKVELFTENPKLLSAIKEIEIPHITLSISNQGKAVNTRFLSFKDIEPFVIVGKYGGYLKDKDTIITEL